MASPITAVGAGFIKFFTYMGEVVVLAGETFASIFTQKIRWRIFMSQIVEIGLRSQSVVVITGCCACWADAVEINARPIRAITP
jgi:ABC-type transporter Mla maintaining outer membrane lipid asymmetry permease subunit MlaE